MPIDGILQSSLHVSIFFYEEKMFVFNVSTKLSQLSSKQCIRFALHKFNPSSSPKSIYSQWPQTRLLMNFSRSFMTTPCRYVSQPKYQGGDRNKSTIYYVLALGVFVGGFSYAAVPLYRIFCQV